MSLECLQGFSLIDTSIYIMLLCGTLQYATNFIYTCLSSINITDSPSLQLRNSHSKDSFELLDVATPSLCSYFHDVMRASYERETD